LSGTIIFRIVDDHYLVSSEAIGYWYLRLNGFLTIPNFVVHPDAGSQQGTDVDVLGVRFPYRNENRIRPMIDAERFRCHRDKAYVALAEIKTGVCRLNGPWTAPERENMQRVLSALGMLSQHEIECAARELYEKGYFENQLYYVTMVCFGAEVREELNERYPRVPQILWPEVKSFIWNRFSKYRKQKSGHVQWDEVGKGMWDLAMQRDPTTRSTVTRERFIELLHVVDPAEF
jgi:hypothetical protein